MERLHISGGTATITTAAGHELRLTDVHLDDELHQESGLRSWSGTGHLNSVELPRDLFTPRATITLADGRTGTVNIAIADSVDTAHTLSITGVGPAPA